MPRLGAHPVKLARIHALAHPGVPGVGVEPTRARGSRDFKFWLGPGLPGTIGHNWRLSGACGLRAPVVGTAVTPWCTTVRSQNDHTWAYLARAPHPPLQASAGTNLLRAHLGRQACQLNPCSAPSETSGTNGRQPSYDQAGQPLWPLTTSSRICALGFAFSSGRRASARWPSSCWRSAFAASQRRSAS